MLIFVRRSTKRSVAITTADPLVRLFRAYRDQNDAAFREAADAIIADNLAANHHGRANELRAAIGTTSDGRHPAHSAGLSALPKRKASVDSLLTIYHEPANTQELLLATESRQRIDRVIEEKQNEKKLARHGFTSKSKLLFWGPLGCGMLPKN